MRDSVNNIGILVTGSTAQPEIRNSYLYDIDYDALYVTGDADPKVFNNKLYAGQGFAVRVYGADGLFCGNEFRTQTTNSGVGIYGSTSSPEFNEDYFQGNLWDMRYIAGSNAVYISAGQPDFGDYPIHRGANDFMYLSYIGDDDYYIHNNSGNLVLAESNYWGVTQPADSFFTGNVDRDPYASSSQGAGPSWKPLVDLYQQAIAAYDQRQYEQAIALFDEILKDYRHERLDRCAFLLLKAAQKSDKLNDYLPLVKSVAQNNPQSSLDHIHRMWQSYAYAQKGDLEAAESVILSAPEYSRSEREGLLSLIGYAVSHGELNRAEEIATRLNSRYPDDAYLARDIAVMLNSPPLVFDHQNTNRPSLGTETNGLHAWPTPFNASTTIQYTVQEAGYTELYVVNMLGQRIRTLVENRMQSGKHRMSWDGKDARGNPVASGVYLVVCKTLEKSATAKILYLK
jgi:tetratricopeptide (TPR) repeat protein